MHTFETPLGRAGWDQVCGMTESVHAELEQMFWQNAKLDLLHSGVGRTVQVDGSADGRVSLHAQMRECQAQAKFHAGRALELAMHVVYACGADRVMGRDYPGNDKGTLRKDRESHSFSALHDRIVGEFTDRDMRGAFEDVYQDALHRGVTDVYLDEELHGSYILTGEHPFLVRNMRSVIDGAGMTLDHADIGRSLSSGEREIFPFSQLPMQTFSEFLEKADAAYYRSETAFRADLSPFPRAVHKEIQA